MPIYSELLTRQTHSVGTAGVVKAFLPSRIARPRVHSRARCDRAWIEHKTHRRDGQWRARHAVEGEFCDARRPAGRRARRTGAHALASAIARYRYILRVPTQLFVVILCSMCVRCRLLPLVSPLVLLPQCLPTAAASPWTQDAFWISFWVGPQVELDELDARVAEIAECNFTGYLGFNGGGKTSPYFPNAPRVAKEIELCDKHGLRCVPSLCDVECCGPTNNSNSSCLAMGQASKNFWGYQLLDESSYPVAGPDSIGSWSRSISAARPGALQFYNLLGAADYTAFKTLDDYAVYVSTFLAGVGPAVLSMDFYPYFAELPSPCPASNGDHCRDTKALYRSTLSVLRSAAEAAPNGPIPFWNFFNAMPYDKMHTDPTEVSKPASVSLFSLHLDSSVKSMMVHHFRAGNASLASHDLPGLWLERCDVLLLLVAQSCILPWRRANCSTRKRRAHDLGPWPPLVRGATPQLNAQDLRWLSSRPSIHRRLSCLEQWQRCGTLACRVQSTG